MDYKYTSWIITTAILVVWFLTEFALITDCAFSPTFSERNKYLTYMKEIDRLVIGSVSIPLIIYYIWVIAPIFDPSSYGLENIAKYFTKK